MSNPEQGYPAEAGCDDPHGDGFWRPLLYRWFVEYNPLYFVSAALVLGGCFLLSRGLASQTSLLAYLGVALVAEVYAVALVGGAALLMRVGQRRSAVMLAFLAFVYQWDLSLHTETCAYFGSIGKLAAASWLAIFAGKLVALAWALRLRLERRVLVVAFAAAIGLALGPQILTHLDRRHAGLLIGVWCFALGAAYRPGGISSRVALTAWGETVLRRGTRVAWAASATLIAGHVLYWMHDRAIGGCYVWPVLPLLFVRRVRSEAWTWIIILSTVALVASSSPTAFWFAALLAGAALALRALSPAFKAESASHARDAVPPADPYRARDVESSTEDVLEVPTIGSVERVRSLLGAAVALYISVWTFHWSGGTWPAHVALLDGALAIAMILIAWRVRVRIALAPVAATYAHWLWWAHLVPVPKTPLELGATFVTLGFALLVGSVVASYCLRRQASP